MTVKPLTEQHLVFLNLKGGYTGSSESIHARMPHCWKGALAWYGKLTWESAHAWILIILCYLIVLGITLIFMVRLGFNAIP